MTRWTSKVARLQAIGATAPAAGPRLCRPAPGRARADRALAAVVAQHAIPRALPEFLIEGLAWDVEGRRYETLDELLAYAARVAAAVGAMMSLLMGVREPAALARACDLGVAMQLSNIARDVGEDARMGRLYLPRAGCARRAPTPMPGWRHRCPTPVSARWCSGCWAPPMGSMPVRPPACRACRSACRPGINAARLLVCRDRPRGVAPWCGGPASAAGPWCPGGARPCCCRRAALQPWPDARALHATPLPACQPLLDAVAQTPPPDRGPAESPTSIRFLIDLFERLERQKQAVEPLG